jgi:hypothetical protein
MPDKTTRLEALLPEVYAARDADGLLHRLLDAVGVRLADGDAAVKALLVSHWLEHARGGGLDALAATFGQQRRMVAGAPESDESLRQRLRSLVARFTGGGTVAAVRGAVRSALGLPFDRTDMPLPPEHPLVAAVDALVALDEFSPEPVTLLQRASTVTVEGSRSRLDLDIDLPSAQPDRPVVELTATLGVSRNISVEVAGTGEGVRAQEELAVRPGETLVLDTVLDAFTARVLGGAGQRVVTHLFTALDGGPPQVPMVAAGPSTWVFRAGSGFPAVFARLGRPGRLGRWSAFDEDTFDLPAFGVALRWTRYTPLTFEVTVPYFLAEAVEALRSQHRFAGPVFTHQGLPREQIQAVVDATRAAGVRGRVRFSLGLPQTGPDRHDVTERLGGVAVIRQREDADVDEVLTAGSVSAIAEKHDQGDRLTLRGVFDVSTFDSGTWAFGT